MKQATQHDEVVERLDKICEFLQAGVTMIGESRSDLGNRATRTPSNTANHHHHHQSQLSSRALGSFQSPPPPHPPPGYYYNLVPEFGTPHPEVEDLYHMGADCGVDHDDDNDDVTSITMQPTLDSDRGMRSTTTTGANANAVDVDDHVASIVAARDNVLKKLSESFFLLEIELKETRERLRDLRAILDTDTDTGTTGNENLRDTIHDLAYGLEGTINQDLHRLFIINGQRGNAAFFHDHLLRRHLGLAGVYGGSNDDNDSADTDCCQPPVKVVLSPRRSRPHHGSHDPITNQDQTESEAETESVFTGWGHHSQNQSHGQTIAQGTPFCNWFPIGNKPGRSRNNGVRS